LDIAELLAIIITIFIVIFQSLVTIWAIKIALTEGDDIIAKFGKWFIGKFHKNPPNKKL
jgi:hypothetical protein